MKKLFPILIIIFSQVSGYTQTAIDTLVLKKVNAFRSEYGLLPLAFDINLQCVASNQANYCAKVGCACHDQYFEVDGIPAEPDFEKRFLVCGSDTANTKVIMMEILAIVIDTTSDGSESMESIANAVVTGWKNSPEHRDAMLIRQITRVGVAHSLGDKLIEYIGMDENWEDVFNISYGKAYCFSLNARE